MLLIGYGIFAILLIIVLVVINVKSTRRARNEEEGAGGPGAESDAEVETLEADRDIEERMLNAVRDPVTEAPEATKDATFRQAMRSLRAGSDSAAPPPARNNDRIISDSDYRRAMQNFRKSGDKRSSASFQQIPYALANDE